jgi:hypothetical protein
MSAPASAQSGDWIAQIKQMCSRQFVARYNINHGWPTLDQFAQDRLHHMIIYWHLDDAAFIGNYLGEIKEYGSPSINQLLSSDDVLVGEKLDMCIMRVRYWQLTGKWYSRTFRHESDPLLSSSSGRMANAVPPQRSQSSTAPRPQSPAPRAPVQAPPPVAQIPPPDPAIVPVLRQIESYRGQCAQERAAIGSEAMAVAMEQGVAKDATRQHDWRDFLRLAGIGEREKPSAVNPVPYASCLYGAYGDKLRASATLSPDEIAGQRIVQGLGNVCASERATAEQTAGSKHLQEYNDLRAYKALAESNGDRESMARLEQGLSHMGGGEPYEQASMAYLHCLAQARLNQMDGGSASSSPQTARVDTSASEANFRDWQKNRSHSVNNHADDATDCLSVVKTGTKVEWGTNGKFKLINTCSYPVEAAWCANTKDCESHVGNLWTIGAGRDYPIFFADESAPDIRVGACRIQSQRTSKVDVVADGRGAGQIDTSHKPPQPAPGVSIMQDHSCD